MNCPYCDTPLEAGAAVCPACGAAIEQPAAVGSVNTTVSFTCRK